MIYIYGDSYACPTHKHDENPNPWYEQLEKKYPITNRAVMGSGPEYAYQKYMKDEKLFTSEDKVIFIHSYASRINWSGLANPMWQNQIQADVSGLLRSDGTIYGDVIVGETGTEETIKFFNEYQDEIKYVYHHYKYNDKISNSVFEKALVIKYIAQLKRIKTYYMVVSSKDWKNLQNYHSPMHNDEWFNLHYTPLLFKSEIPPLELRNHLTKKEHNVLFRDVLDFLE